jgi:metal-responsive CopG/Arc/MetJ family transcriptional regulator
MRKHKRIGSDYDDHYEFKCALTVRIPVSLLEELDALARQCAVQRAELVRDMLRREIAMRKASP